MVFDAIFTILAALFTFVLGLFPSWTDPVIEVSGTPVVNYAYDFGTRVALLGQWVNVSLLLTCFGIALAVWLVVPTVRLVVWLYDRFPFKAT